MALGELLAERDRAAEAGSPVVREVSVTAPDPAALLAEWVGELAFLAESEGFVPRLADRLEVRDDAVFAAVHGRIGSPPHLIKAVTYHRLEMREGPRGWRASLVLDV